jgi:hypothetical protein
VIIRLRAALSRGWAPDAFFHDFTKIQPFRLCDAGCSELESTLPERIGPSRQALKPS